MAVALAPVASALGRSVVLRTLLSAHAAARPWRIPPEDAAHWLRMYAQAPAFWELLESLDDWRAPVPACPTTIAWGERDRLLIFSRQAPRARRVLPDGAPRRAARLRARPDLGRPGAGRRRAAQRFTAS